MKTLYIIFVSVIIFSCNNKPNKSLNGSSEKEINEQIEKSIIDFGHSEKIPGTNIYLYPINISEKKENLLEYSRSYKGRYYKSFNLAFYNIKTNETHLLIPGKQNSIITNYPNNLDNDKPSNKKKENQLFYEIIDEDFNDDGEISFDDPKKLFTSNIDGSNLRSISPSYLNLISWKFVDKANNLIELRCSTDENNDGNFDSDEAKKVIIAKIDSTNVNYLEPFSKEFLYNLKKQRISQAK